MAKLLLIDSNKVTEIQMGQEITIGRAYSNLLRLEGEEVSRVHGIIYRRGADYILRDLDSKNGIILNGQRVTNSLIAPGDDIQVGNYHVVFDPPASFDLGQFLRKRKINVPVEITVVKGMEAETGSAMKPEESQSVSFRPGVGASSSHQKALDGPSIFITQAEVSQILDSKQSGDGSTRFAFDVVKLHTGLQAAMPKSVSPEDPGTTCQPLMELLVPIIGADRGVIVFQEPESEKLNLGAILPKDHEVSVNRVVLRACLRRKAAVICGDAQNEKEFAKTETVRKEGIGSILAYPLTKGDVAYGLLYFDTLHRKDAFRKDQLALLSMVGQLLGMMARLDVASASRG